MTSRTRTDRRPARSRIFGPVLWLIGSVVALSCSTSTGSIGAILGKNHATGRVTVREVPADMGSARAGLEAGDQVLLIDGRDVRSMTAEQIHEALVGPIGTKVALTVERDGRILRLEVVRGRLREGAPPQVK